MDEYSDTPDNQANSDFQEASGSTSIIAFFLGMGVITSAIILGRSFVFYFSFLVLSIFLTLLWRKVPRPWVNLVSISAATPIAISQQQYACSVVFACWFSITNMKYLARLPMWIYPLSGLAMLGVVSSSINWMGANMLGSMMRQASYALNFLLAPFMLLPLVYVRMRDSRDHRANLQGLLFCLVLPSTLTLLSAKLLGNVTNSWEASLHVASEGFLQYRLGNVVVNFLRTEVGFILAALICASSAVAFSEVRPLYRLVAGLCLASNVFLLLCTASFGSVFACFCGLSAIFFVQLRTGGTVRVIVSMIVIFCILILIYVFSPPSIKEYLESRFEHRVTNANTDRLTLWSRGLDQFFRHPEGVGLTFVVGDKVKSFIHNDYITYAVSYGFAGGIAYLFLVAGLIISFLRVGKLGTDDPSALAVYLAGLGVIVSLAVNGITDHSNENRWYFNIIWSLIWYSYFCSCAARPENETYAIDKDRVIC